MSEISSFIGSSCSASRSDLSSAASSGNEGLSVEDSSFGIGARCTGVDSSFCDDGIKSGTGIPGTGKSLYAIWRHCQKAPTRGPKTLRTCSNLGKIRSRRPGHSALRRASTCASLLPTESTH